MSSETEELLNCYVISILLYDNEFCTIFSHMKRLVMIRDAILLMNMRIPWNDHVSNQKILKKIRTKKSILVFSIR